jgi:hypothetical protein
VADEVEVEAIIDFRGDERTEKLVRFFIGGVLWNPRDGGPTYMEAVEIAEEYRGIENGNEGESKRLTWP